jgi:hypothetical protein
LFQGRLKRIVEIADVLGDEGKNVPMKGEEGKLLAAYIAQVNAHMWAR